MAAIQALTLVKILGFASKEAVSASPDTTRASPGTEDVG
jgi:hypothetical protein